MSDPPGSPPSGGALPDHLDRLLIGRMPARLALTVLACAEDPGLPTGLWRSGAVALAGGGNDVTDEQLLSFARGPAIAGAVVGDSLDGEPVHRLSPYATEEVLPPAARSAVQGRLTVAWLAYGRDLGWPNAPGYLLRHLPRHALAAGLVDVLLEDDGYLAHADLDRLTPVALNARTRAGRLRACLLQATPQAASVTGEARTAMFGVTEVMEGLEAGPGTAPAPYRGLWARTGSRAEHHELAGHTDDVNAACQVLVAGEPMLATGGSDRTVRLWDPVTARLDQVLLGHSGQVRAVCAVGDGGRELLASGGADHTVRLWDPMSGQAVRILAGHTDGVAALCRVASRDGEWLASGGADSTVRVWDPATGLTVRVLTGHTGSITALCEAPVGGLTLLAVASRGGTVRLWDPGSGRLVRVFEHGVRGERGMCVLAVEGRTLLATAGADGSVRLSDLAADTPPEVIGEGLDVGALCPVSVGGRSRLATAENLGPYEHVLRLWDLASRRPPQEIRGGDPIAAMCEVSFGGRTRLALATANGDPSMFTPGTGTVLLAEPDGGEAGPVSHTAPVTSLAAVRAGRRTMVASASSDHTVRLWDPANGRAVWSARAHVTEVRALSSVPAEEGDLLASAGDNTVRIWRPETGEEAMVLHGHTYAVAAVCPVVSGGRRLLASGAYDRTIRLWDPDTGRTVRILESPSAVYALCTVEVEGRTLLVSAGAEGMLQQWDPATGASGRRLEGHTGWIRGLCVVRAGGSTLLASGGSDGTVRLWDPGTGTPARVLTGHTAEVSGVCPVSVDGAAMLASAGMDGEVRLWDPATGRPAAVIPVRAPATACVEVDGTVVIGLDTGLLALRLSGR